MARAGQVSGLAILVAAVVGGVARVVLGGPEPTVGAGSTVERLDVAAQAR